MNQRDYDGFRRQIWDISSVGMTYGVHTAVRIGLLLLLRIARAVEKENSIFEEVTHEG